MDQNIEHNEKKHNYFYKITNLINGKYYYGIRSTDTPPDIDKYMGSGNAIKSAIEKYGKENFIKEIIADYPTRKEASDHEKRIVTIELISLDECYNCRTGGDNEYAFREEHCVGINNPMFGKSHSEYSKLKMSEVALNRPPISDEVREKLSIAGIGKVHTEESKRKMSESTSGENHPRFGKKSTEEEKENNRRGNVGKIISDEQKLAISKANKGKKITEETRQKMIDSWKIRKQTNYLKQIDVPKVEVFRYEVDGIKFHNAVEVANYFNLSRDAARGRCYSENPTWNNWKVIYEERNIENNNIG